MQTLEAVEACGAGWVGVGLHVQNVWWSGGWGAFGCLVYKWLCDLEAVGGCSMAVPSSGCLPPIHALVLKCRTHVHAARLSVLSLLFDLAMRVHVLQECCTGCCVCACPSV